MNTADGMEVKPRPPAVLSSKSLFVALSVLFLLVSPFLPAPAEMAGAGLTALAVLFVGISLWLTEMIPPAVTSILLLVLFSAFGTLDFEEATSGFGKEVIWLMIAMLGMGVAVEKTGLARRIALLMLIQARGNTYLTILLLIGISFFLTFFIPNAMARLTILISISQGLIHALQSESENPNVSKAIMLAITFVPWVCTVVIMTGGNGSIYTAGLFEQMVGYQMSYLFWLKVMLPGTLVILFCLWLILIFLFPPKKKVVRQGLQYLKDSLQEQGPLSKAEKKLMVLYLLLLTLWITKEWHGFSIPMSACAVAILCYLPGLNLLQWDEAMKKINWGIPILFAAGYAIADALEKSGVILWLSNAALKYLIGLPPLIMGLVLMLLLMVIRIGFANYASMAISLMPVVITFAMATPYNPVWIGMIGLVSCSMQYILPTQTISNMTTYALGYYKSWDMIRAGGLLSAAVIAVTLLFAYFYWPLAGLPME